MKIAVIGGGVSGLVAAYLLGRAHEVDLFEAAPTLGGHTYTVPVREGEREIPVDMGFIVYNEATYPLFSRLLAELDVATQPSTMSFAVRCDRTDFEYNGTTLNTLFAQRSNLLRPSFYRMVNGILRFHRKALDALDEGEDLSLGELLRRLRIPQVTVDRYLVPMSAAIWSTPPSRVLEFSARSFLRFLDNHGMLTVDDRPEWRVVRGGSRRYVEALEARLRARVHRGTPIASVRRTERGPRVRPVDGEEQAFDRVVLAVHSDQALRLLADPSPEERRILGAIGYLENPSVLHTDRRFLPRRPLARASWNYHLNGAGPPGVSYWMNLLQGLDAERDYLVTLNRNDAIDPASRLHEVRFSHPQFDVGTPAAQAAWNEISGPRGTYYCGAYWRFGFHEDGVMSGVRVAESLGVPWGSGMGGGT